MGQSPASERRKRRGSTTLMTLLFPLSRVGASPPRFVNLCPSLLIIWCSLSLACLGSNISVVPNPTTWLRSLSFCFDEVGWASKYPRRVVDNGNHIMNLSTPVYYCFNFPEFGNPSPGSRTASSFFWSRSIRVIANLSVHVGMYMFWWAHACVESCSTWEPPFIQWINDNRHVLQAKLHD